ncbi:MAG TPA: ABC transporter ATP-binding protein [Nitrospirae bacterium]|nr:ABC transporter ATP-binding protein [Nitrospirota bacterium]
MIELKDVNKVYGNLKALDSVNLHIRKGEVLGLVGPNGAGKSTMLKIILGIAKPTSGTVLINGKVPSEKDWREFKASVGYMPERVAFYDNLTGMETLKLFARIKGTKIDRMINMVKRILSEDILKRKVGGYSKGMRQRLNLAQALLNDPDILILDEPTSGLDPVGSREFYHILKDIEERKEITVILSSHILAELEDKTDRIAIIKNGSIKAAGSLKELYRRLKLPLKLQITIKDKDEVLEGMLRGLGVSDIGYRNGYLIASVPSENKLRVLSAMLQEKERFQDITIKEPNLEEVFFGVH